MKKLLCICLILALTGCVTMRYTDGNKSVEYTSLFRTAEKISGNLPEGTIEVGGQKIDAKFIELLNNIVKAAEAL